MSLRKFLECSREKSNSRFERGFFVFKIRLDSSSMLGISLGSEERKFFFFSDAEAYMDLMREKTRKDRIVFNQIR